MHGAVNLVPQNCLARIERARRARRWYALNALLGAAILLIAALTLPFSPRFVLGGQPPEHNSAARRVVEQRLVALASERERLMLLARDELAASTNSKGCIDQLVSFMNAAPDTIRLTEIRALARPVVATSRPAVATTPKAASQPTAPAAPAPPPLTIEIRGVAPSHEELRRLISVAQSADGWASVRLQRASSEASEPGVLAFVLECAARGEGP